MLRDAGPSPDPTINRGCCLMKIYAACILVGACCCLEAQDIPLGRSEPPYVEATVTMPTKLINNPEKRADMVSDLAEKSEMNYRLLALKIGQKWQSSIRGDKEFLKNVRQAKSVAFTVKENGSIVIAPVEDKPDTDAKANKSDGREKRKRRSPPPAKDSAPDFGTDTGR